MIQITGLQKKIGSFLLVFFVAFMGGVVLGNIREKSEDILTKIEKGRQINILLMGIDARSVKENSRSDTMVLASVDTEKKKAALVWIPRDTRVAVSAKSNVKINSFNFTKGPEAACTEVGKLLNVNVDYYVVTNFNGFAKIIDTLGGVDIEVETHMRHYDPDYPELNINIPAGMQHLAGYDAVNYVRYRGGPTADIGRTQRQAKFVKAVFDQTMKSSTILKLPELIPQLTDNIRSNIPLTELAYLASIAKDFNVADLHTQTLPGYSFTAADGGSYWEADKNSASTMIADLMSGKTFDVINDPPKWVSKQPVAASTNKPAASVNTETETDQAEKTDEEENEETTENKVIIPTDLDEGPFQDERGKETKETKELNNLAEDKEKKDSGTSGAEPNQKTPPSAANSSEDENKTEKQPTTPNTDTNKNITTPNYQDIKV